MPKLPYSFYQQEDVISLAVQLLGKQLFTLIDGKLTGGTGSSVKVGECLGIYF